MRKPVLLFCFIACISVICGCSGGVIPPEPEDQSDRFVSVLYVNFVDSAGNNLAANLATNSLTSIDRNEYSLFYHFLSYCRGYPCYNWNFADSKLNMLLFEAYNKGEVPKYVRYDLQCPKIFGDDKFHVIESTYSSKSEKYDFVYICSSFSLDGVDFQVDKNGSVVVCLPARGN